MCHLFKFFIILFINHCTVSNKFAYDCIHESLLLAIQYSGMHLVSEIRQDRYSKNRTEQSEYSIIRTNTNTTMLIKVNRGSIDEAKLGFQAAQSNEFSIKFY